MMETIQAIFALYRERGDWFLGLLREHFLLSGQAILLSGAIGLLLGVWISQHPRLAPAVTPIKTLGRRRVKNTFSPISPAAFPEITLRISGSERG